MEGLKKKKKLIKYCTQYWPTYSLEGGETWPQLGSLEFNTILQLSLYCKCKGKYKEVPYVQAFMALYQDSEKKRKCKLEDFDKGSFKVLLARSEPEDPLDLLLTPSALAERSQGKEVQTSQEVTRPGLKVTGPERMSLTVALAPPPYVPSPMGLQSGSKLCPLQKERSSLDKICPLREVPDGEGGTMHVHAPFSMQDFTQCREQFGTYSENTPKNLAMNLSILALSSPSPGGI